MYSIVFTGALGFDGHGSSGSYHGCDLYGGVHFGITIKVSQLGRHSSYRLRVLINSRWVVEREYALAGIVPASAFYFANEGKNAIMFSFGPIV